MSEPRRSPSDGFLDPSAGFSSVHTQYMEALNFEYLRLSFSLYNDSSTDVEANAFVRFASMLRIVLHWSYEGAMQSTQF